MADINIVALINSIKIRPALYNKNNCMYYSNKKFKYKLWREVCQEVYKDWEQYTPQDKLEYARELQKRWKSLRTCFTRELALQKKEKIKRETSGGPIKKRKKYEYFNSLIFLLHPDNAQDYNTSKDSDSETDPFETLVQTSVPEEVDSTCQQTQTVASVQYSEVGETVQQEAYDRAPLDEQLLEMYREYRKSEEDEDRQFLLSIASVFRKMDDKKRLEARIEVLKLLQRIIYRVDDTHNQYI